MSEKYSVFEFYPELLRVALLGTERQKPPMPQQSPLSALAVQLNPAEPEGALLGAVAAVALYERAGRLPAHDPQPLPSPCPADETLPCTPRAGQHLALMLGGQYHELLPEWLAALAAVARRVPEVRLPELLELGRTQPALQPAILSIIGRRGCWLAALNPAWDYAADGPLDVETGWEAGDRPTRERLLQKLRQSDPAYARELLATTWTQESGENRAAFLAAFENGLSMDDEPLLEAALDDRRREVRLEASNLLAQLPQSRLVQRMLERMRPLLQLKPDGFEIELPEVCDKAMQRDGLEPRPPTSRMGERSFWLVQMIERVPPTCWCEIWDKSPAELIQLATGHEWEKHLVAGWLAAAARCGDQNWASALLADDTQFLTPDWMQLVRSLPPAKREALVLGRLNSGTPAVAGSANTLELLNLCTHQWSLELSRAVLHYYQAQVRDNPNDYGWRQALKKFARYVAPSLFHEAGQGWPTDLKEQAGLTNAIEDFLTILQFRFEMLKELSR